MVCFDIDARDTVRLDGSFAQQSGRKPLLQRVAERSPRLRVAAPVRMRQASRDISKA
jgi:hypothetical protein